MRGQVLPLEELSEVEVGLDRGDDHVLDGVLQLRERGDQDRVLLEDARQRLDVVLVLGREGPPGPSSIVILLLVSITIIVTITITITRWKRELMNR